MAPIDDDSPFDWSTIITYDAAGGLSLYDLTERSADRMSFPFESHTAHDELAELACMSALARWLIRWQPIVIHRAILAGASPEEVAAALGTSAEQACRVWHEWAIRQREFSIGGRRGVSIEEYGTVQPSSPAASRPRR